MSSRATRQDVALNAGVSGATVSRVYNDPSRVDPTTAERVRASAIALGFVPDRHASALRRRSSTTFLFLEIERPIPYRWASQRYFQSLYGEIMRALLHELQGTPWHMEAVTLTSRELIPLLSSGRDFSGILGFDVDDQETADDLAALGRPVVCCHHNGQLRGVHTVTTDNFAGGVLQAQYLNSLGHTKVAYLTGRRDEVLSHERRWRGFTSLVNPVRALDDVLGFSAGEAAGQLLAQDFRRGALTAVACVNDITAWGVIQGLRSQGIHFPQDAVVVGYDNLVLTELLDGGLPTVEARLPHIYTRAFAILAKQASKPTAEIHETIVPELVLPSRSAIRS